jgi:hypothetical protein
MTLQEIIAEIPNLSYEDRISILEVVVSSLKKDIYLSEERARRSASKDVRGLIRFSDGHIPDDKEIDELRWQALQEKYLQ